MKFSIIITNFNKAPYLDKCINSCIHQNHSNFEIILGDNNSDDDSLKILEKYKKKITFFEQKKKSNVPAANQINLIKKAYQYANGDYICFLDSDDFFLEDKIKTLDILLSQGEFDVVFDLPKILKNSKNLVSFKYKNKNRKNIWSTIVPTSSITILKPFLGEMIQNNFELKIA